MACDTLYHKKNDDYATPKWLKDSLFKDWFDPCPLAIGGCFQIDGLSQPWKDRTFVNPPYSEPLKWVKKAIEENRKGKTIALLLKYDCSTEWYRQLLSAGAHIIAVNERLHFGDKKAAPFCSMIAILYGGSDQ
jgi:hypothetical protein